MILARRQPALGCACYLATPDHQIVLAVAKGSGHEVIAPLKAMLRQQGQQRRPQQSVVVAKIRGGTGQQQGEVEDAGPVGHCCAAAVTHMDGPAFAGELLAGRLIAGQTHVLAGDNQALGRLPEVGAGQAVMGTVPQPALLLGQYLIRGVAGGQGGKQDIGHEGASWAEAAQHSTRGGKQGKAPHGGALPVC
ncbi:hypothetical protein D3C86_1558920 [compost metagenome]